MSYSTSVVHNMQSDKGPRDRKIFRHLDGVNSAEFPATTSTCSAMSSPKTSRKNAAAVAKVGTAEFDLSDLDANVDTFRQGTQGT